MGFSISYQKIQPEFLYTKKLEKVLNSPETNAEHLEEMCEVYRSTEPVMLQLTSTKRLYKSLIVLNENTNNNKPIIAACIPPKTGTSNWQILLNSIYKNVSIAESFKTKKLVGDAFYSNLPRLFSINGEPSINSKNLRLIKSGKMDAIIDLFSEKLKVGRNSDKIDPINNKPIHPRPIAVMNARHPLARIISAWRSKFTIYSSGFNNSVTKSFLAQIHDCKNQDDDLNIHPPKRMYCSFRTFLNLLVTKWANQTQLARERVNEHFTPITYLCAPCTIPYGLVTKSENSVSDARVFLKKLNNSGFYFPGLELPGKYNHTFIKGETDHEIVSSIKTFTQDVDKDDLRKFYDIYYWDFVLFGYEMKMFL